MCVCVCVMYGAAVSYFICTFPHQSGHVRQVRGLARRFSEFKDLDAKLRVDFPDLPPLPAKRVFGSMSAQLVAEVSVGTRCTMRLCAGDMHMCVCVCVCA